MWEEIVYVLKLIWDKVVEIVQQPIINKDMLWILIPIISALCLVEFYFARYKEEELGWNTAVGNSLCLFFVGMNLCSFLSRNDMLVGFGAAQAAGPVLAKSIIAYFIVFEALFLILLNFFHLVSKRFAFGISSGLIMNFISTIAIIVVYSNIAIDWLMIPAVLVMFLIMIIFFQFIRLISPEAEEEDED